MTQSNRLYKWLLPDLERQVVEFNESFTRWEA